MSKISVVIPTYNRDFYLEKLLKTIPNNISSFVSDNGSFSSSSIKKKYPHVKFSSIKEVIPIYNNWNRAVLLTDSEWVCLASDDDIFLENYFSELKSYINKYSKTDVIICGHEVIDEESKVISRWIPKSQQYYEAPNGYNSFKYGVDARVIGILFKKELFNKIGGFDETYKVTASDSLFIQRLLIHGNVLFVPKTLCQYRVWKKNLTNQTIATKEWVDEVIRWQTSIVNELESLGFLRKQLILNKDEVIARNILGGMGTLSQQKKGFNEVFSHLKKFKYPIYATLLTHLKIFKCLLGTLVKK